MTVDREIDIHRYLQWIDGAYIELASGKPRAMSPSVFRRTLGLLKTHALLGTEIALSDAQINDSHAILHLFSDKSFYDYYLKRHPDFLTLKIRPEATVETDPFSLATVSLKRSLENSWISSVFDSTKWQQELSETLLENGEISSTELEQQLKNPKSKYRNILQNAPPKYRSLLEGMLRCVAHFATSRTRVKLSTYKGKRRTLYDVLRETRNKSGIPPDHEQVLDKTLDFIDTNIEDEQQRGYQSVVFNALDRVLRNHRHPSYNIIKHTVHHAWSTALETSLDTNVTSLGHFRSRAVHPGLYINKPTDAFVPINKGNRNLVAKLRDRLAVVMRSHPANLSWYDVAIMTTEIKDQAKRFQRALLTGDSSEMTEASNELICGLRQLMLTTSLPTQARINEDWLWVCETWVPVLVGHTSEYLVPGTTTYSQEQAHMHMRRLLYWGQDSLITNALRKVSKEVRLRPRIQEGG
ncbi:MAG: hypothetical protein ISS52_00770 [Dehalococcoidia bacterium]|nr:hypothetical protein [Dehalococcoidia bacterium]